MKKYLPLMFILFALVGCKEKEIELPIELKYETGTLYYDDTYQYLVKQGDTELNNRNYEWEVFDPKIGSIDANGLFTAKRIGETKVIVKENGKQIWDPIVRITPYSTLYTEPILVFGQDKGFIKKDESRKLLAEKDESILYEGESTKIRNVLYLLKDNKMTSVVALLQNTSAVATEASTFLKERYTFTGSADGVYYFEDKDKVSVGLTVDSQLGLTVLYFPYTPNKRLSADGEDIKSALTKLRATIK